MTTGRCLVIKDWEMCPPYTGKSYKSYVVFNKYNEILNSGVIGCVLDFSTPSDMADRTEAFMAREFMEHSIMYDLFSLKEIFILMLIDDNLPSRDRIEQGVVGLSVDESIAHILGVPVTSIDWYKKEILQKRERVRKKWGKKKW